MRRGILPLAAAALLLSWAALAASELCRSVPAAVEVTLEEGCAVTEGPFGLAAEFGGDWDGQPCVILVTNAAYGTVAALSMADGAYFPPNRERQAVIPDSLAEKWFGATGISGATLTVAGADYTVCGVYRESRFARRTAVYLSDHPRLQAVSATVALLPGNQEPAAQLAHNAALGPGGALRDFRPVRRLAWQVVYLGLFFSLWGLLARLFFYGGRQLAVLPGKRKRGPRGMLQYAAKGCAAYALGAALLRALLLGVRIPPEYLPRDNPFDVSHYAAQIAAFYARSPMDVYDLTAAKIMPVVAILSMIAAAFGIRGTYCLKGSARR